MDSNSNVSNIGNVNTSQHQNYFTNDETLANLFQSYEWSYANNLEFSSSSAISPQHQPQPHAGPSSGAIRNNTQLNNSMQHDDLDSWLMADLSGLTGDATAAEKQTQINPSFAQSLISSQLQANNPAAAASSSTFTTFNAQQFHHHQSIPPIPMNQNNPLPPGVDPVALQQYLTSIGVTLPQQQEQSLSTLADTATSTSTTTTKSKRKSTSSNKRKPTTSASASKKDKQVPKQAEADAEEADHTTDSDSSSTRNHQQPPTSPLNKRKKNTIASQKFRARKKQRDAELAQTLQDQAATIKSLNEKMALQEIELNFLKKVVAGFSSGGGGAGVLNALSSS